MKQTFTNKGFEKQFKDKGYVVLPLLTRKDISRLLGVLDLFADSIKEPFHATHFSSDVSYKKTAHDLISQIVFSKIEPYLCGHKPIFGNFMVKNPDPTVHMQLHADWAYVDETKYRSIAIWAPLTDTDETNGCLGVIDGSHKVINEIRGPGIEQSSYRHDEKWVELYGKLLPMKAGEAIVYDHALMHYSLPNKSGVPRPALNLSVVPVDVPVIHYFSASRNDDIEMYQADNTDFFLNYTSFQRPSTGTKIRSISRDTFELIDERMNLHYGFGLPLHKKIIRGFTKIFNS